MKRIDFDFGSFELKAKDGRMSLWCTAAGEERLLHEFPGFYCADPYLFLDKSGGLFVFFTALQGQDEATAQIIGAYAPKGDYGADFVNFAWYDGLYPRLGGSFTPDRESPGVNEETDRFAKALADRYRELFKSGGLNTENFEDYIEEKRLLALGKLYGVKISGNNYPFARRTGFSLKGQPLETEFEGKKALILPVYSEIFNLAILLYSFDGGLNFDSGDYIICSLQKEDVFELTAKEEGLNLNIVSRGESHPVGKTEDFGITWERLYDPKRFVPSRGLGEKPLKEKKWYFKNKIKFFGLPRPAKCFKLIKTIAAGEGVLDFTPKKKYVKKPTDYSPVPIEGLDGYEVPLIEDIFPPIKEHAHGSGIAALPDGELLSVWFQADGERKANDGRILAARKPVGEAWQDPFVIADVQGLADCNPTLFLDKNDRLWLFWYPVLSNAWETSQPKYRFAEKGDYEYAKGYKTHPKWTGFGLLNPGRTKELQGKAVAYENGSYTYGPPNGECRYITPEQFKENPLHESEYVKIEDRYITDPFVVALRNSTLDMIEYIRQGRKYFGLTPLMEIYLWWEAERICKYAAGADSAYKKWKPIKRCLGWQTKNKPIEFEYKGKTRLLLPLYTDGIHCSLTAYTDDGGKSWNYSLPFVSVAPEQATNVLKADGTLKSYFRNSEPAKRVVSFESDDGGESFGRVRHEDALLHEGGFDMVKLKSGPWVMSITQKHVEKGVRHGNRSHFSIAVSLDEGESWTLTPLEWDKGGLRDFHYSAITEDAEGNIYVSYSHDNEEGKNNIRCAKIKKKAD
jgi:hypothetical protein